MTTHTIKDKGRARAERMWNFLYFLIRKVLFFVSNNKSLATEKQNGTFSIFYIEQSFNHKENNNNHL